MYSLIGFPYAREKDKPYKCKVVFIGINEEYKVFNVRFEGKDYMWQFHEEDIGKTIFFTREEVEAALKERE